MGTENTKETKEDEIKTSKLKKEDVIESKLIII